MKQAPVYRWGTDAQGNREPWLAGELRQLHGRWEFQFDPGYLRRNDQAWELDPKTIRLKQGAPFIKTGTEPFGVFCDTALSGWSLDALQQRRRALLGTTASTEPWGWWERLLYAPAEGFGALFVGDLEKKPDAEPLLVEAIEQIDPQTLAETALESSSGAMGGERPKVTVYMQDRHRGRRQILMKFPMATERADAVVAEATALTLARELGMNVPWHGVLNLRGHPALGIERFDREPGGSPSPIHCVSAATALGMFPGTDPDSPLRSYVALRSMLKTPGDALELYRRIILNAVVGNTDDHPWNTSLQQHGLGDWRLSPLYDVLPFFQRRGTPAFRMAILRSGARSGSRANLVAAGREIAGLHAQDADDEVSRIEQHVRHRWKTIFMEHASGVQAAEAARWQPVFEHDGTFE